MEEDVRVELSDIEIKVKGLEQELHRSVLEDIRYMEKTMMKMKTEGEGETDFLKKQVSQLISEKIKIQQHVISLTSRVNNTETDVCERPHEEEPRNDLSQAG